MKGFREKFKKPPFLGILAKNGQFWKFLAKMGETGFFFKKAFGKFFSLLKALINCKVSEKSNEGIPRKMQKNSIFGHFGQKWPILDNFWHKMLMRHFYEIFDIL